MPSQYGFHGRRVTQDLSLSKSAHGGGCEHWAWACPPLRRPNAVCFGRWAVRTSFEAEPQ